ncbi:peptidoglycan-binding protein [Irregularibacter muris]|uniref:Peptidoglycan-binding protein n=1 Tax=Irregularibacter muris TaxID=1796619 RepID=A0AAE3L2K0_9FIRM|nr:peptidoglycan-binding protein [Irregularibacter muris]MCR1898724.1 peptidoglycan-binding protein [Irregularibacter muris]
MTLKRNGFKSAVVAFTVAGMLSISAIPAYAALGDRVLKKGMTHGDVKVLQQHLKDLGFFSYKDTTTYFGDITRNAVMDFQKSKGLAVDGSFGPASFKALQTSIQPTNPGSSSSSVLNYSRPLRLGLSGADVHGLQEALKKLGYLNIANCTNYFGTQTQQAVKSFQAAQGLAVDGSFGPATYKALESALKGTNSNLKPTQPTNPAGTLTYNRLLKLGISGTDVNALQEALKKLGYLNIANCTNYFGAQTQQALRSFQQAQGIAVDGLAGPQTIQTINNALSGKGSSTSPSTPNRGDENRRILTSGIINTAKIYLNPKVPYVFGGSTTKGFDCSGYTQFVYKQNGISIPRTSELQANAGSYVSRANLQPGDLIIFSNTYRSGPSHTGIYLGDDQFIHSSSSNNGITISSLNTAYYRDHFSYGRRVY